MPRKRNGFVPLGDIAGGVELPHRFISSYTYVSCGNRV